MTFIYIQCSAGYLVNEERAYAMYGFTYQQHYLNSCLYINCSAGDLVNEERAYAMYGFTYQQHYLNSSLPDMALLTKVKAMGPRNQGCGSTFNFADQDPAVFSIRIQLVFSSCGSRIRIQLNKFGKNYLMKSFLELKRQKRLLKS